MSSVRRSVSRLGGVALVALLHGAALVALLHGLARRPVEPSPPPLIMAAIIPDSKPEPPPLVQPPQLPPPAKTLPVAPPPPVAPPVKRVIKPRPPPPAVAVPASPASAPPSPQAVVAAVSAAPAPPAEAPAAPPSPPVHLPARVDGAHTCRPPVYPAASRRLAESGAVILKFLIDESGAVEDSAVETSSGYPRLDEAARDALSLCRFTPGTVDGRPERAWARIQYIWKLD